MLFLYFTLNRLLYFSRYNCLFAFICSRNITMLSRRPNIMTLFSKSPFCGPNAPFYQSHHYTVLDNFPSVGYNFAFKV